MASLRVRHPGRPPADIDLGPCVSDPWDQKRGIRGAALMGEMQPVVTAGGLMAMSPHEGAKDVNRAFSIHREQAWIVRPSMKMKRKWLAPTQDPDVQKRLEFAERCGYIMPLLGEPCARTKGHSEETNGKGHRSRHDLDGRAARKRAKAA